MTIAGSGRVSISGGVGGGGTVAVTGGVDAICWVPMGGNRVGVVDISWAPVTGGRIGNSVGGESGIGGQLSGGVGSGGGVLEVCGTLCCA